MNLSGMQLMLFSFVGVALLIAAWILVYAAPEVSIVQRIALGSLPVAVSVLISWLAWGDA